MLQVRWVGRVVGCLLCCCVALAAEGEPQRADDASAKLSEGWYARIETTVGTIVVRLLPRQAPQSVAHFSALARGELEWVDPLTGETEKGHYYDEIPIHRVKANQRFETGDRSGTGDGAPFLYVPLEGKGPVNFNRPGRLGMTRYSGGRFSAVVFFVTASGMPWLNGKHPCFGEVVSGLDVVSAISRVDSDRGERPIEPIWIRRIRVFSVGEPPALPQPQTYRPSPRFFQQATPGSSAPGS